MNTVMMEINTTEAALCEIETEAAKYDGLYVDMEDPKQRKFAKDKAAEINGILKAVDRARIDLSKGYKRLVEDEASEIRTRLENANKPFTLLIDDYAIDRKRILDAEKAKRLADELAIQKGIDHEFALLLDKSHAADKAEAERLQVERDDAIRKEAANEAIRQQEAERLAANLEAKRIADMRIEDKEHQAQVNNEILKYLIGQPLWITHESAKKIIILAAKGKLGNMVINY